MNAVRCGTATERETVSDLHKHLAVPLSQTAVPAQLTCGYVESGTASRPTFTKGAGQRACPTVPIKGCVGWDTDTHPPLPPQRIHIASTVSHMPASHPRLTLSRLQPPALRTRPSPSTSSVGTARRHRHRPLLPMRSTHPRRRAVRLGPRRHEQQQQRREPARSPLLQPGDGPTMVTDRHHPGEGGSSMALRPPVGLPAAGRNLDESGALGLPRFEVTGGVRRRLPSVGS
jgi:hypothetical protein